MFHTAQIFGFEMCKYLLNNLCRQRRYIFFHLLLLLLSSSHFFAPISYRIFWYYGQTHRHSMFFTRQLIDNHAIWSQTQPFSVSKYMCCNHCTEYCAKMDVSVRLCPHCRNHSFAMFTNAVNGIGIRHRTRCWAPAARHPIDAESL